MRWAQIRSGLALLSMMKWPVKRRDGNRVTRRKRARVYEELMLAAEADQKDIELRRHQLRYGQRVCTNLDAEFDGDIWDAPRCSFEDPILFLLMHKLHIFLKRRYQVSLPALRFLASYFAVFCGVCVLLAAVLVRKILTSS